MGPGAAGPPRSLQALKAIKTNRNPTAIEARRTNENSKSRRFVKIVGITVISGEFR